MEQYELSALWEKVKEVLSHEMNEVSFTTWIEPLIPRNISDSVLSLEATDPFYQSMIKNRYTSLIENSVFTITKTHYTVEILLKNELSAADKAAQKPTEANTDPLNNQSNLNPKYVFETFVVGKSNMLAHAAALAVAEAPGTTYNPLFLYGGVGLGKTHLMHSIAHYILSQNPSAKIVYASAEKFMNELINAIRYETNAEFRNKYRNIDVLLIDDIQFIAEKEGTQEEFFHTFNALHEANKQIIISSDRPPKEIKPLEDRLRSRFEWGLIADIQPPDYETRLAILRKKADSEKISVPDDVMDFIAKSIDSNIRELEGSLTRVLAYAKLTKAEKITLDFAANALKDLFANDKPNVITIDFIQQIVASHYNIKLDDIKSKKRTQEITYPRQVAMYLCRKLTDNSLPKIGEAFGGRDHTTILHGYEKISNDLAKNESLQKTIAELEKKINGQ